MKGKQATEVSCKPAYPSVLLQEDVWASTPAVMAGYPEVSDVTSQCLLSLTAHLSYCSIFNSLSDTNVPKRWSTSTRMLILKEVCTCGVMICNGTMNHNGSGRPDQLPQIRNCGTVVHDHKSARGLWTPGLLSRL